MQWTFGDGASHPLTWPAGALGVPYPQAQPDGEAGPPHPAAIWAVFNAESGAAPFTVTTTISWDVVWGYQEDVTVTPGGVPVQTTLWLYREPGPTVSYTLTYPVTAVPSLLRPPPRAVGRDEAQRAEADAAACRHRRGCPPPGRAEPPAYPG